MLKKIGMVAALAAVAGCAFAAFAPAASAEEGRETDTVLRGRGVLSAHGTGVAAAKGRLDMQVNANRGILLVKDLAGDAFVRVEGHGGTTEGNGFTVYFGVGGEAIINGSNVAVIVVGTDIDMRVLGKGWAYLKGRGQYFVNGRGPFLWSEEGAFAGFGDESP